jgi:hypothetical protein
MLKGRGLLVVAALSACGSWSRAALAQQVFSDSFESSPTSWTLFEEVVGGNPGRVRRVLFSSPD